MKRLPWTFAQHQRWSRAALMAGVANIALVATAAENAYVLWLFGKWVEECIPKMP